MTCTLYLNTVVKKNGVSDGKANFLNCLLSYFECNINVIRILITILRSFTTTLSRNYTAENMNRKQIIKSFIFKTWKYFSHHFKHFYRFSFTFFLQTNNLKWINKNWWWNWWKMCNSRQSLFWNSFCIFFEIITSLCEGLLFAGYLLHLF